MNRNNQNQGISCNRARQVVNASYQNRRLIEAIGRRVGVSESDLPDLVQRVAFTMYRRHAAVEYGAEVGYLSEVTRREAGHLLRAARRKLERSDFELPELSCDSNAEEHLLMHRALQRLRALLETMPRPMRDVWLSHVVEGEPCSVVAATLHVPLGTVKSRLRRAWSAVLECG